jgi:glucose dehydrogenase
MVYRRKRPDLFMLAGACLSLIVCITTLVAKLMLERSEAAGLMLFLAMLVVVEAAAAAIWLKRVHAEMSL